MPPGCRTLRGGQLPRFTISDNNFGIDATLFQTIGSHQLSASLAYAHTALSSPTFMGIKQNQGYNSIVGSVDFGKIRQSYAYSAKLKIDRLAATDKIEMGPRNPYLEPGANTAIDLALNGRISSASGKIGGLLELGFAISTAKDMNSSAGSTNSPHSEPQRTLQ